MKLCIPLRWLLRPVVLGVLIAATCAAWHFRPLSRDVLIPVVFRDGRWGYVNDAGRIAIPALWEYAEPFDDNGLALVSKDLLWGWIDRQGAVKIPLEWDDAQPFDRDGTALVGRKGKWCCIDPAGQFVKDIKPSRGMGTPDYRYLVRPFNWSRLLWDRWADLPAESQIIEFSRQPGFDPMGWSCCKKNGKWGWVDRDDKTMLPFLWDQSDDFDSHDMAAVGKDNRLGWIDRKGNIVIPIVWDTSSDFDKAGYARVSKNGKFGWIDRAGKVVIPLEWDNSWNFDEREMSAVRIEKLFGWIDRNGKIVIPLEWDATDDFQELSGLANVQKQEKRGMIDRAGNAIVPAEWEHINIHADQTSVHLVAWRNAVASSFNRCVEWIANGFKAPTDRERALCHVYDRSGRVVWRSDDATSHLPVLIGALALGVAGLDALRRLWARRSRTRSASDGIA